MAHAFAFYTLTPETLRTTGIAPVPLPVRRSRVKRLLRGRTVPLEEILNELDLYLSEHPEQRERYREAAALHARVFGVTLGRAGQLAAAGRCFEIGLALRPDDAGLRAHYAVVLHGLGMLEDALGEYRRIVDDPAAAVDPVIWMLAARAHAEHGEHARALRLLRECQPLIAGDGVVAKLIRDLEKPARRPGRRGRAAPVAGTPAAAPAQARFCTQCGTAVAPDKKFCTACGSPMRR